MKTLVLLALIAVEVGLAARQDLLDRPGRWRSLTDMKSVRSLALSQGAIWAASAGGIFQWNRLTRSMTKYTNSEGLSSNDITAMMIDHSGRVWAGTLDGSINMLEPGSNGWIVIDDIKNSTHVKKRIKTFSFSGDSLFIGTDFGVSVFRLSRWEFGDTYGNFGFSAPASVNSVVVVGDRLWIATDKGVATAQRFLTNLSAPTNWVRFQRGQGLPSDTVTAAALFHDTLVVGTFSGIAFYDGTTFQEIPSMSGREIVSLVASQNELGELERTAGYQLRLLSALGGNSTGIASHPSHVPTALVYDQSASSWLVGTADEGIDEWSGTPGSIVPTGPSSNLISSLAVDNNGAMWYATGISGQGKGFGRYNPEVAMPDQWKNFTAEDNPVMLSDDYYKVNIGRDNRVWVSSWGTGVVEVVADSIRRRLDANSTPALAGSVSNNPVYAVIGSVCVDPEGYEWIVNRTALNGNYLARLVTDTSFTYVTNTHTPGQGTFTAMIIDRNGSKWLANAEPSNKPTTGLYYFNEYNRISGTSAAGGWGWFTVSDGLPDNTVLSLAVDFEGSVCVGTNLGLMIISDPLFPKQRHFSSFPLREQSIQALAVDALNNKWVGTKEGVFVMNSDATQILQQYTTTSTGGKLVDNDIRALAIDQKRGIAYIGTEKGLSSLSIEPVLPVRSPTELTVGPNPFTLPAENSLVIGNLVAESSIKILTINGSVVSEFKAQGAGRAFWNGRDRKGNIVGSGIYVVVAFAENGDQVASGKIAVIRKE